MAFDKVAWRKAYYEANKARYLEWARAAQERKKAARGPVKIGRPPSAVPVEERKRRKRQKDKERLARLAQSHDGHIYVGSVCKRGHSPERYVKTGHCVACKSEQQKAAYAKDPDRFSAASKKWSSKNKDKVRETARALYWKNPEKFRAKVLAQIKRNPARANAAVMKRTAAKMQRTPKLANLRKIEKVYMLCAEMRKQTGIKYVVDHIVPLRGERVSGLHVHENLQIITNVENVKKKNHFVIE